MNKILSSFAVLFVTFAAACACPGVVTPGLEVTVVDADTGEAICDATVVAIEGGERETLEPVGSGADCYYQGADDRGGDFVVEVTRAGFEPAERDVSVDEGTCGPATESLEFALAAE
jgi:hypothetical protein